MIKRQVDFGIFARTIGASGVSNASLYPTTEGSFLIYLNGTGDYIQHYVYGSLGTTFQLDNGGTNFGSYTFFSGVYIRGT